MTKETMQRCYADPAVQRTVRYFARGVAERRPNGIDLEDAEHDIWEAIFKSLDRWTGQKSLTDFARSVAYSKYGHMIEPRINHTNYMNENAVRGKEIELPSEDRSFANVEVGITLDRIEAVLASECRRTRQYRIALKTIKLLRKGFTQSETAAELGITPGYVRMALCRLRKSVTQLALV